MNINRARRLLESGVSLRKAAREMGISYSKFRGLAVKEGLYSPQLNLEADGRVKCKGCLGIFNQNEFPKLHESKYFCRPCIRAYMHKVQIAKIGCTPEQYDVLYKEQNGRCAVCGKEYGHITRRGVRAKLAVDHDHGSGEIRGLLCTGCNRGLGYLGEDNLKKAVEYLERGGLWTKMATWHHPLIFDN